MKTSFLTAFITLALTSSNVLAGTIPSTPDLPAAVPTSAFDDISGSVRRQTVSTRDSNPIAKLDLKPDLSSRADTSTADEADPDIVLNVAIPPDTSKSSRSLYQRQDGNPDIVLNVAVPPDTSKSSRSLYRRQDGDANPSVSVKLTSPNGATNRRTLVKRQTGDLPSPEEITSGDINPPVGSPSGVVSTIAGVVGDILGLLKRQNDATSPPVSVQLTASPTPNTKRDETGTDLVDIQYLNYALTLEQFQHAFYEHYINKFSEDDFRKAGYPDWVRSRFLEIVEKEKVHKEFLESAIVASGSEGVVPADYKFPDGDVHAFLEKSVAIETIAAAAYVGSLQSFTNKAYVTAEASILADTARKASWINSAVRKQNPWNAPFEAALTPNQVLTLLTPFFTPQSTSPKSNIALLPPNVHANPTLTLSKQLIPGQESEISFPYSPDSTSPDFLFVTFLSGAETIIGRVVEREAPETGAPTKRYFIDIPEDLVSKGAVYVSVVKAKSAEIGEVRIDDEGSVVAGPAIAMFPFDAHGKAM